MRAIDFVHSYFAAWNHADPVAVADHLASEGRYFDVPEKACRSKAQLVASLYRYFAASRHQYELIGEILDGANTIAFQYQMRPLAPAGDRAAGMIIRGSEFITLDGNAAITICDYYDRLDRGWRGGKKMRSVPARGSAKYAKSGLGAARFNACLERLEHLMRAQQVYLQPDLTLPALAAMLNCSVNHLSQVVNAGFGMGYYDYLNRHRIEYAKQLLVAPGRQNSAVLNIAFAVGFNSNSAFYTAFRKLVGQTPAQYRQAKLRAIH